MKNMFILLFLLVTFSCNCKNKTTEPTEYFFNVDLNAIEPFGFHAEQRWYHVQTNVSFTATSSEPSWCTVEAVQHLDDNLSISVANNDGIDERTADVTIAASGFDEVKITVIQKANSFLLYQRKLNDKELYPELIRNDVASAYTAEGLEVTGKNGLIRLNKHYALTNRLIRYHVRFSNDAKVIFQSSIGDFTANVDVLLKTISIETNPVISKQIDFINPDHEYLIEIYRIYQTAKVRIVDLSTGQSDEIEATNDGRGGVGAGAVNAGFNVGMQHDYYCFGLQRGTLLLMKQISVISGAYDLTLLIYGDSITETEGYYPKNDYPQSWTQLIMNRINGEAMTSGRWGCTITQVMERIKNELPYVKAKYVMVTIGTNGGNTQANLTALVEYIIAQGAIPILNNIPCNESGTQIATNQLIEWVRQKYQINGCKFDLATSLEQDGKEVDKTTMWHEDYGSNGQIYHHPNVQGSLLMFNRTLIDVPEIYE